METLNIYKIPILNREEKIFGYELFPENKNIEELLFNITEEIDFKDIFEDKYILIKVSNIFFEKEIFKIFSYEKLIFEIDLSLINQNKNILDIIRNNRNSLKNLCLYIDSKNFDSNCIDIFNFVSTSIKNLENTILDLNIIEKLKTKKILKDVNNRSSFEKYKENFDYFEGFFFEEVKTVKEKFLTPYETTVLNLINKLSDPNIEISEIEKIIKTDVNLSVDLLKFINSPIFSLRKEINSIRQALAILGIKNLYKWLFLLLFAKDKNATENPVFSTALIRAKIMEELANYLLKKKKILDKELPEKAYLVGILSLIDAMFQIPKENILEKINLAPEIKEAILEEKNTLGELLKITKLLEKGSLFSIKTQIEKKGIPIDKALAIRFQAYKYAREVLKSLKS